MMPTEPVLIVKRYANRKLYDTEAKRYITLADLAAAIRQGRQIEVRDHASGADLTSQVLTQIVFEQERGRSGGLPREVLTSLVRAGGEALESVRASLSRPIEFFQDIDMELERRVAALRGRGELAEDEARRLLERLLGGQWLPVRWEARELEALESAIEARGVPRRADLQALVQRIEALSAQLDEIGQTSG